MPLPKARKKKTVRSRRRIGVAAIPVNKGWISCQTYFHQEIDKKENAGFIKTYVKNNYNKTEAKKILACPEYLFTMYTHHGCTAFWLNSDLPLDAHENQQNYVDGFKRFLGELVERGEVILKEKKAEEKEKKNIVVLSPQQRLQKKINNTIMTDLDDLEDSWILGEKTDIDVYQLFRKYGLAGSATLPVKKLVDGWLLDYEDAYHKRCEQAVEGYSHLKRPEINRRIKVCKQILDDLDRVKNATKAQRKLRIKKPVTADKQVARVKYAKENKDYKIVSIPPVTIIGQRRLYTFNCKTRMLAEYVTDATSGFVISGSTIKNFDTVSSRQVKLRKPDEFLVSIATKSPTQINKLWSELTTKSSVPNGRINADTILLRVVDK